MGVPEALAAVAHCKGDLARQDGDVGAARTYLHIAERLTRHLTLAPQLEGLIAAALGHLETAEGDLMAARARHERALERALYARDAPVVGRVIVGLADLALRLDRPDATAALLEASDTIRGGPDLSLPDAA